MQVVPPDANPPLRLLSYTVSVFSQPQPDWLITVTGRDMWVAARLNDGHEFTVDAADNDATTRFSHRSAKVRRTARKRPLPDWARYPAGVVATLGDTGLRIPGFHAVVMGDEPQGPRYDFGMGVVFAALCCELTATPYTQDSLVEITEQVRRDYIKP